MLLFSTSLLFIIGYNKHIKSKQTNSHITPIKLDLSFMGKMWPLSIEVKEDYYPSKKEELKTSKCQTCLQTASNFPCTTTWSASNSMGSYKGFAASNLTKEPVL